MRKKEGFTLVELLVVIAIIALLMSMLIPVIGKVKSQAKDVVCQSNLKQWGAVFSMYANDNQNHFMAGWMDKLTKHTDQWPSALRPYYADNGDLRLCPMATKLSSEENGQGAIMPLSRHEAWGAFAGTPGDESSAWSAGDYGSYGINAWVCNPLPESTLYEGPWKGLDKSHWRGDNVREAATVPLFADCMWLDAWPVPREGPPPFPDWVFITKNTRNSMRRVCIPRHNVHVNYLFLDYSVDRVDLKQLWVLKWHRTFNTCGPFTKCGGMDPSDWPQWMRKLKDY